jgi:predicted transposase/invertase (TIGR01784 family)
VPEIKQAFEFAREGNLSPEELDELQHQEFFIQDQHNAIVKAERQGLNRGLEQGERNATRAMATKLLDMLDDEAISRATGLSLAEIAELRNTRSQDQ